MLAVARLAQGIATGAAITTLGAALVDLNPPHAPGRAGLVNGVGALGGLALGALGCGALVQFAPAPTHLVYALLLGGMLLAAIVVARMPRRPPAAPARWRRCSPASASRPACGRTSTRSCRSSSRAGRSAGCTCRSGRPSRRACSACTATSSAASS